jgi:predicted CXXCH cytochrome family protein
MIRQIALQLSLIVLFVVLGRPEYASAGVPVRHDDPNCRRCHSGADATAVSPAGERSRCTGCHQQATAKDDDGLSFHGDSRVSCTHCHRYHDPDVVLTARGDISLAALAGVDREHCRACHAPGRRLDQLSAGHEAAAAVYHRDATVLAGLSPSAACRGCHSRDTGIAAWQGAIEGRAISFADHTSHPCEVVVQPGQATVGSWIQQDIDPRLRLPGGKIECVTCHDLTAKTPDLLVAFDRPRDLCLGCHLLKRETPGPIAALDLTLAKKSQRYEGIN